MNNNQKLEQTRIIKNRKKKIKELAYIVAAITVMSGMSSNAYALADELARASDGMITPLWSWINAITPTCTAIGAISGGLFASGDLATRGKGAITGAVAFAGAAEFIKLLLVG